LYWLETFIWLYRRTEFFIISNFKIQTLFLKNYFFYNLQQDLFTFCCPQNNKILQNYSFARQIKAVARQTLTNAQKLRNSFLTEKNIFCFCCNMKNTHNWKEIESTAQQLSKNSFISIVHFPCVAATLSGKFSLSLSPFSRLLMDRLLFSEKNRIILLNTYCLHFTCYWHFTAVLEQFTCYFERLNGSENCSWRSFRIVFLKLF
jgi:hypothetical protein